VARKTFMEVAGVTQPAPAPRFGRTQPEVIRPPAHPGQHTDEALADWGLAADEIARLRDAKAIA
jgi:alpha-methylacyl-CoA racemase